METIMAEKINYSDQTPKEEQAPVPQASDNTTTASSPVDESEQAEDSLRAEKKAKIGLKNAPGQLPRDQI
jgi:hypothetical protein